MKRLNLPEDMGELVSTSPECDDVFWLAVSQSAIEAVWGNSADDIYEQLLDS